MDASLRAEVERLYQGMTPEQIAAHEDWVRRYHASDEGKASAAAREDARVAPSASVLLRWNATP